MTDGLGAVVARQAGASGRWTSFVGDQQPPGRSMRALHEEGRPERWVREHDRHTLLVHIGDDTQRDAATAAHSPLYE